MPLLFLGFKSISQAYLKLLKQGYTGFYIPLLKSFEITYDHKINLLFMYKKFRKHLTRRALQQ